MKAIVLHAYGPPENLTYEDAPDPTPKAGEVRVRVRATSVNPVDWMHRSGVIHSFLPITFPYIVGLDLAGTIEGTGKRVVGFARHTYAELCVAPEADLVPMPDGLSFEDAATLPLVVITGETLALKGAKPAKGETVLVTAAVGGVGRAAVFAAVEAGARVIAGVRGKRVDEARKLPGIADVVALDDAAALAALPMLDAVADSVAGDFAATLVKKVRAGGRYACFMAARSRIPEAPGVEINALNGIPNAATVKRYADAMAAGKFSLPIAKVLPLAQAAEAQRLAETSPGGKFVLTP